MTDAISGEEVYRRTKSGQREVVFERSPMSETSRSVLMMVNGNTSLSDLTRLSSPYHAVRPLLEAGFIERVHAQ